MKAYCFYDIRENNNYGRYAVASKDFEAGDIIVFDLPFAYGPKSDSPPICLGCHTGISCKNVCSTCYWPVCNEKCEKLSIHAENECKIFSKVKIKFTSVHNINDACAQYECITPLRVLLAKERDPQKWETQVKLLESHSDKRINTEIWNVETVNIVKFLHQVCKLKDRFTEEIIHFVCGLLEVNAFSVPTAFGFEMRCLYPKASLLIHSCAPNSGHYIFKESNATDHNEKLHCIYIRAMTAIEKGQELQISYTQTLLPTLFRRAYLKEGKFFDCSCRRCSDPTELGTHLSTLKCSVCQNGWVLSKNPLDEKAEWNCDSCEFQTTSKFVITLLNHIQNEINELERVKNADPILSREAFIKKYSSVLHPNHALLLRVKSSLTQLYGNIEGYYLHELPNILLEKKIQLCNLINDISLRIKPGLSRQRGWNFHELYNPIIKLAKNYLIQKHIDACEYNVELLKAIHYLEEIVLIFSFEDPESLEGNAGRQALAFLKDLRGIIKDL